MRTLLDVLAVGAVADEAEAGVHTAVSQPAEGEQDVVDALDRGHPADPADDELVGRDAVEAAKRGAVTAARDAVVQVDPEPDHAELLGRSNAELRRGRRAPPD